MKYCGVCSAYVSNKNFSWKLFIALTILTVIGGIVYSVFYIINKQRCPFCGKKIFVSEVKMNGHTTESRYIL